MRASDLYLGELLSFEKEGVVRFAGQRALILDAVALGLLRRELIETLGMAAARGILTRFGYAHGWCTAESLKRNFPWDDDAEWMDAGPRLHTLQGLVMAEQTSRGPGWGPHAAGTAVWHDSYEAEQHVLHLGQADEPVCWTLAGFASGYSSFVNGSEVYCVEERCRGKGDAVCQVVARTREDWGEALGSLLPFYEKAGLSDALQRVVAELKRAETRLRARQRQLGSEIAGVTDVSSLVAQSAAMKKALGLARRLAKVDSTVLVTGESGVGKERIARVIHDESSRLGRPFVAINCGAVPENLLESELFGHAKGAFTGASQERAGLFEAASGGTLLLDEIGEVSPAMQVKLLRVLQEREVRRVGENKTRSVNVRLLAATNRDLSAEVNAGRFRQDLLYRLRVIEIKVPPLRERREDILPLARTFLKAAGEQTHRRNLRLSPQAAQQLVRYGWPGNVRELQNAVEHAVVLSSGDRIELEDLPEALTLAPPSTLGPDDARTLDEVEREYIIWVLRAHGGNRAKAAQQLQIGTATLYRKLKQYESLARVPGGEGRVKRNR